MYWGFRVWVCFTAVYCRRENTRPIARRFERFHQMHTISCWRGQKTASPRKTPIQKKKGPAHFVVHCTVGHPLYAHSLCRYLLRSGAQIYTKIRTTMRKIAPNINQHANQASSSSSSSSSSSRPGINAPIAPVAKFRAHTTVPPRSATTAAASSTSGVASSAASEPAPPKSDPCGKS